MGWYDDDDAINPDPFVSLQTESPVLYYLNYVLVIGCLLVLACAFYVVIRECCHINEKEEDEEIIIMHQPPAPVPHYTETTAERAQSHNHRILHEYSRQSATAPLPESQLGTNQVAPYWYYKPPANYYYTHSHQTQNSMDVGRIVAVPANAPAQQMVVRNHGNTTQPPRERPPPYAPTP